MRRARLAALVSVLTLAGCSGGSDPSSPNVSAPTVSSSSAFVADVRTALDAVEAELGGPQEYFEVTATRRLTNIFVAVDDATAVIPYVWLDGELQEPGPKQTGAAGQTFTAAAVDFDEATVLAGVEADLPTASIDAFSVEGGAGGFVRYVVSARSAQGGVLDIVVSPSGSVIEVSPL